MSNTLTIVIPNRSRDLNTVRRSLASIVSQLSDITRLVIVDYGSELSYQIKLEQLVKSLNNIELILCPTQGQLWNKSRCINMVLISCTTSHFMVSDMDMIWHPRFIKNQVELLSKNETVYFSVGIMTEEESSLKKSFEEYQIKFQTDDEATGISIFPTEQLFDINGFDEFYHGWGSEDTDVHVRLKNAGYEVRFRESEIFFKHQWHAKTYRSKQSTSPFHPKLERINQSYLLLTQESNRTKANVNVEWGENCSNEIYSKINKPSVFIKRYAIEQDLQAITYFLKDNNLDEIVEVQITEHPESKSLKNRVKKVLGKKTPTFISLNKANEILLEAIIMNHHNCPYFYSHDSSTSKIILRIKC